MNALRSVNLGAGLRDVPVARRQVRDACRSWALDDIGPTAELLASELVTNAVVHGGGATCLLLRAGGDGLHVSVCDSGPDRAQPLRPSRAGRDATHGRGLQLVDALADSWGTGGDPADGTWVWFTLRSTDAGPSADPPRAPEVPGTSPQAVLRGLAAAVVVCDGDGRVTDANPAAERLVGRPFADLAGGVLLPGTDPAESARRLPEIRRRVAADGAWEGDLVIRAGDGAPRVCRCTVTALGAAGDPSGLVVLARDVTDEAAAAARVADAEQRWRLTLDHAPIGIALVDLDGRWLRVNDALCRIVGYSRHELLLRSFQELTHPDDLDADFALAARLLTGELDHYTLEKRFVHASGHDVRVRTSVALAWGEDGEPLHYVAHAEDVTEQRQVTQRLAGVISSASDAFVSVDTDGVLTEWNAAAARMFGWTRPEALGRSFAGLVLPHERRADGSGLDTHLPWSPGTREELVALRRDGSRLPVEVTVWSGEDAPGERHAFLRDLSDRDRVAEQARRAARQDAIVEAQLDIAQVELTPTTILRHVCERAMVLTGAAGAAVELLAGDAPVCRAVVGGDPALVGAPLPLPNDLSRAVALAGRPRVCNDVLAELPVGAGSVLLVPLRAGERVFGVVSVFGTASTRFSPDDLAALDLLAGPFGTAISNAWHLETTSRRARTDPLTGLPNRTHALHELDRRLGCPDGARTAVAFLDLDGFKAVNDTLGHSAGDELLVAVAARLRGVVRSTDTPARYGGDEFLVLCDLNGPGDEEVLAGRLVDAVAGTYALEAGAAEIGVSVGVAVAEGPAGASQLLQAADAAMYEAKQAGGRAHRSRTVR